MYKRLFYQFILCNMILFTAWISVFYAGQSPAAEKVYLRTILSNMRYEPLYAGQDIKDAGEDGAELYCPGDITTDIPLLKAESFYVTTGSIFSRQPDNTADGRRIVEYSELKHTRIFLSNSDYDTLLKIVEAEAGGEDEAGRMMVAGVVLNRVASDVFPDTVEGVVHQKLNGTYQFSPVANGRFQRVKISDETIVDDFLKSLSGTLRQH